MPPEQEIKIVVVETKRRVCGQQPALIHGLVLPMEASLASA